MMIPLFHQKLFVTEYQYSGNSGPEIKKIKKQAFINKFDPIIFLKGKLC
jgi:hypothetical protein